MLNKNRIMNRFISNDDQDFFLEKMQLAFPRLHDFVDQCDFHIIDEEQKKIYKETLASALRRVRNFFIGTGIASNTDFSEAIYAMFEKNNNISSDEKFLKFAIMENIENYKNKSGYIDTSDVSIKVKEKFLTRNTESPLEDILIHELVHYFNQCFDIKYFEDGNVVVVESNPRNEHSENFLKRSKTSRYNGHTKFEKDEKYLTESVFLIEGYTQLATELIKPSSIKSYEPQVKMVELLQFISGVGYDITDFMHLDISRIVKAVGNVEMRQFIHLCDTFHNKYYDSELRIENQNSFTNDKDYIYAQNILIDIYLQKLEQKYHKTYDVAGCARDLAELINYIPVMNEGMADYFASKLSKFVGYDLNNNEDIKNLVTEIFNKQLERNGAHKRIASTKNVCIESFFHEEKGFGISVMGEDFLLDKKDISELSIDENFKAKVIIYDDNRVFVEVSDAKSGETLEFFSIVVDEKEGTVKTFENVTHRDFPVVNFFRGDHEKVSEQNLNYLENIVAAKRLKRKIEEKNIYNITKITLLHLNNREGAKNSRIVLIDDAEGERFFLYDDGKNFEIVPLENIRKCRGKTILCNGLFVEKNESEQFYLKKLAKVEVKKEFVISADSVFEREIIVREIKDSQGKTSFSYFNGNYDVELQTQEVFDISNNELTRAWFGKNERNSSSDFASNSNQ